MASPPKILSPTRLPPLLPISPLPPRSRFPLRDKKIQLPNYSLQLGNQFRVSWARINFNRQSAPLVNGHHCPPAIAFATSGQPLYQTIYTAQGFFQKKFGTPKNAKTPIKNPIPPPSPPIPLRPGPNNVPIRAKRSSAPPRGSIALAPRQIPKGCREIK